MRGGFAAATALGLGLACASPGEPAGGDAADGECAAPPGWTCAVAAPAYAADALRRVFVGSGYRALWTARLEVPLLDLGRTGGGLVPVRVVGGGQSANLALRGGDGRAYTFRPLEKDLARLLPSRLRRAVPPLARLVRDQGAALHPGATLVASALARAAGLLEVEVALVAMPDDPRLGAFRARFARRLGTFAEYPTPPGAGRPGTFRAGEIVPTDALLARLDADDVGVDARAYLRARLVDLVVGDADRHPGNWRWARIPGRAGWQPLPEDRDLAFARFDGALLRKAKPFAPLLVTFGPDYELARLAHEAHALDARLLAPLPASAWREEARAVQAALAPALVEAALDGLPAAWRRLDGGWLADALGSRIAGLPAAADRLWEEARAAADD